VSPKNPADRIAQHRTADEGNPEKYENAEGLGSKSHARDPGSAWAYGTEPFALRLADRRELCRV